MISDWIVTALPKQQAEVLSDAFLEAGYETAAEPEYGVGYRLRIGQEGDSKVAHPIAALLVDEDSDIAILHDRTGIAKKTLHKLGLQKHLVSERPIPFKHLEIHGRRWVSGTHGNTYHTAEIFIDGKLVHKTKIDYGYGDQYIASAVEWLVKNKYLPKMWLQEPIWHLRDDYGVQTKYYATDVKRQRDL
jgi:hypothetical protein